MSDPYDFDIALPTTPSNAGQSTGKHRGFIDSDDDGSDVSGSLSDVSGMSSDNDSEVSSRVDQRQRAELTSKRQDKNFNEPRTASGSALDRAKNFLSKYSSATPGSSPASKAPTRSRISLDSDEDDDFSMESSHGDKDISSTQTATIIKSVVATHDHDQISEDYGFVTKTNAVRLADDEADSDHSSDHASPYDTTRTNPSLMDRRDESNSGESRHGDSIESFQSDASEERSKKRTVVESPQPRYQDRQEESADDYNDSFQEESLSHSNVVNDHQRYIQQNQDTALTSVKVHQSIASESGIYEEEVFEEEDSTLAPTTSPSAIVPTPILSTEKTFDYSMEFSDDDGGGKPQLERSQTIADNPVRQDLAPESSKSRSVSGQSDTDNDNEEQSSLLESDSFTEVKRDERTVDVIDVGVPQIVQQSTSKKAAAVHSAPASEKLSESQEHTSFEHDSPSNFVDKEKNKPALPHEVIGTPPRTAPQTSLRQPEPVGVGVTASKRSRVTIVRVFEPNEAKQVEMKDASTQFTGNHAAIQAELIPDGMHNLFVPAPSLPTAPTSHELPPSDTTPSLSPNRQQQQQPPPPPPPPVPPLLGSSMYSLDALTLPVMASSSIYKQQLLALQEQIIQKKHETERIVHDRMTFQYSSLRGTERFIAARRTQKLELWEALMRVDPTLDERKAREVARLAQAAST